MRLIKFKEAVIIMSIALVVAGAVGIYMGQSTLWMEIREYIMMVSSFSIVYFFLGKKVNSHSNLRDVAVVADQYQDFPTDEGLEKLRKALKKVEL